MEKTLAAKDKDFYNGNWNGLHAILDPKVYYLLHWMRKSHDSIWHKIPKEIIDLIVRWIPYM